MNQKDLGTIKSFAALIESYGLTKAHLIVRELLNYLEESYHGVFIESSEAHKALKEVAEDLEVEKGDLECRVEGLDDEIRDLRIENRELSVRIETLELELEGFRS